MEHAPRNVQIVRRGESRPPVVDDMNRREFVKKVVAGGASAAVVNRGLDEYTSYLDDKDTHEKEMTEAIDNIVKEVVTEGESASRYFDSSVAAEVKVMDSDGVRAIEYIDVINTILEHGQMVGIESDIIRDRLERMLPAIAFSESRLDIDAFNPESGTFGVFQLRPDTWAELVEEGETKESLEDQVKVAARLLEQSYQHLSQTCQEELDEVKKRFFDGDESAFEEYFLLPTVINSYFSGMGTMEDVIKTFTEDFKTADELRALSPEGKHYLTERDVFTGMSHAAHGFQWNKKYGEESAAYPYKPYAAYKVMTESLDEFVKGSTSNQDV